jgi:non-canonical (house-cleaning) NTP pyrophosphatase
MSKQIQVVTDCNGAKFKAIKKIFDRHFKHVEMKYVEPVKMQTPIASTDLTFSIKKRLHGLTKDWVFTNKRTYFCTIQRGYFFDGNCWFLNAAVTILDPDGKQARNFTSSIQIESSVSQAKNQYRDKTMRSLLYEKFPTWKADTSVYTLHTKEPEEAWFEKPLDHCLTYLSL